MFFLGVCREITHLDKSPCLLLRSSMFDSNMNEKTSSNTLELSRGEMSAVMFDESRATWNRLLLYSKDKENHTYFHMILNSEQNLLVNDLIRMNAVISLFSNSINQEIVNIIYDLISELISLNIPNQKLINIANQLLKTIESYMGEFKKEFPFYPLDQFYEES